MKRSSLGVVSGLAALTLLATGCLGGGSSSSKNSKEETAKTTIQLMYAFTGDQSDGFKKDVDEWAAANGVTIEYIPASKFEEQLPTRVRAGNAPDIAIFPQPGILRQMAEQGKLAELSTQVDLAKLQADVIPGFLDSATVDGKVYGAPMSMNGKSFFWYSKQAFAAKGYTVPKTQDELIALIDKIKADGGTPFCYGMESGSATGWPASDWIEDYVLQTSGKDVYDKWVKGETKFDSPEIRKAFDIYTQLLMTEGNVYGGIGNAASNSFSTALNPMFDAQPKCYMGKQGNFITQKGYFPADVAADLDNKVGVFRTPSVNGESPMLGGGDLAAAFTTNDKNVKKLMAFMTTDPTFGKNQSKTGAWLSPLKSFDSANYPNQTLRDVVEGVKTASVFRFDGSDQMPAKVGTDTFLKGLVSYTSGKSDLDSTLKSIDSSWPAE